VKTGRGVREGSSAGTKRIDIFRWKGERPERHLKAFNGRRKCLGKNSHIPTRGLRPLKKSRFEGTARRREPGREYRKRKRVFYIYGNSAHKSESGQVIAGEQ